MDANGHECFSLYSRSFASISGCFLRRDIQPSNREWIRLRRGFEGHVRLRRPGPEQAWMDKAMADRLLIHTNVEAVFAFIERGVGHQFDARWVWNYHRNTSRP
jgi:hypothetical protein